MNKLYIRFGNIPANDISKNQLTDKLELGLSVYDCIQEGEKYKIIMPKLIYGNCVGLSGCIDRNPIYLMEGNIIGLGSDGEPLLSNGKILKTLEIKDGELA